MSVRSLLVAVLMSLLAIPVYSSPALAAPAPTALPGAYPTPDEDPFYSPPQGFASRPNGAVLRARPVRATTLSIPLPARAEQLLYKTIDAQGRAIATVTTVMVPLAPWTGAGPRPLVSYQTAEDSVASRCAPSYALRAGLPVITSNAESETTVMASLLARGWAVVTSDYEGPTSNFLAGPQEGRGVLDGIRAALTHHLGGIGPRTPVGLWGYSGGAFATAWAIQSQGKYAPELHLAGSALGGVPADLEPAMRLIDGGFGSGLVMGGLIGLQRAYPGAGLEAMFTPTGAAALRAGEDDCTVDLLTRYAFTPVSTYTKSATPFDDARFRQVLRSNSPLGKGAPKAPVYSYHAEGDELVPVAVADALVSSYCRAGTPVQRVRYPSGEHNLTLIAGVPGAEDFLASRFAGAKVVNTCPS
jgi:hypothetical protein